MKKIAARETLAFIGNIGKICPALIQKLASEELRILVAAPTEAQFAETKDQLSGLAGIPAIELVNCVKDSCWEADSIAFVDPGNVEEHVLERIKEVATQKTLLCIFTEKGEGKFSSAAVLKVQQALPYSKVVGAQLNLEKATVSLMGKDREAIIHSTRLFEKSGFLVDFPANEFKSEIMKVDIWSDVRCPFCYIGKKKFEMALSQFPQKEKTEVIWHSFELDPALKTKPEISMVEYFSAAKGVPPKQAEQMFENTSRIAGEVGLDLNLKDAVIANSFNAHRLIQMAKSKGLGDESEEQLFKLHFTDRKNIDDTETLVQAGISIGLQEGEVREMLTSGAFTKEVNEDETRAGDLGIRGVPFFVFNDKYAISGAQSPEVFLETLHKAWEEFDRENSPFIVTDGDACSTDGKCK